MWSLRAMSRRAPESARRLSTLCYRQPLRTASRTSPLSSSWAQKFRVGPAATFSTTRMERASESQVNEELASKIESELSMEKEMRDPEAFPAHLKEYIENSPFEIHDIPGQEEVLMTRNYGDEKIRVSFSIDDLNNVDEDADSMDGDQSMIDDLDDPSDIPDDVQSGGASSKGAINQGRTRGGNIRVAPEDSVAPADRPELLDEEREQDEEEQEPSFPSHCCITVERPKKGTLQIEAVAQDGLMVIENVFYYKDGKLADPKSRADEEAARDLYTGPPFGNLDEDLQLLFEKYLEERGVNTTMALFVPEYIDFKEQREYMNWLQSIKTFVE